MKTRQIKLLFLPILIMFLSFGVFGQQPHDLQFPTKDKTEVDIDREKEALKKYITQQLEYTEDALYMLETEVLIHKDQMTESVQEEASEVYANVLTYKSVLSDQLETIDNQTAEEWKKLHFDLAHFWDNIEEEMDEAALRAKDAFE